MSEMLDAADVALKEIKSNRDWRLECEYLRRRVAELESCCNGLEVELKDYALRLEEKTLELAALSREPDNVNQTADGYANKYVVAQLQLTACEKERDSWRQRVIELENQPTPTVMLEQYNKLYAELVVSQHRAKQFQLALELIANEKEMIANSITVPIAIARESLSFPHDTPALNATAKDVEQHQWLYECAGRG